MTSLLKLHAAETSQLHAVEISQLQNAQTKHSSLQTQNHHPHSPTKLIALFGTTIVVLAPEGIAPHPHQFNT